MNAKMQPVPVTEEDRLLTFQESMNYLRVSRSTLYRIMKAGQLSGRKVGATWRFLYKDLKAYVRAA